MTIDNKWMISLRDAALLLGVSHSNLRRHCRLGTVKAQKFGRDWFLMESVADARRSLRSVPRPGTYERVK